MTELCRCPICGGSPSVIQYITSVEDRGWSVGCLRCKVFANDKDRDNAIRVWNEINSRECEPAPILKPCPFCGSTDVHLIENDRGKSEVSITCKDCNVWVDHMFDAMSREEAIALWNRRVKE